ncbi:MAG: D-cysteine desulfhydrase family protein [Deltaproteobacteria bacterium]|nr:D-cysteine desulfhydrase family protein [Deltaproteobacteria bacterium]
MKLAYPPRIDLARRQTPLQPLRRLGQKLGVELYVKRDDLTGAALSGNKIRKLEFVMADALSQNADIVITCGGAQSNHCRATALAAARLGLGCRLLLRTPEPANPPPSEGNILLDRLAGAAIVWITPAEYKNRDTLMQREAELLRQAGRRPYIIPEGASNALGAWGYIGAAEELAADIAGLPGDSAQPVTILHATGSGGTAAGLILGAKLLGLKARVASINVCDDRDHFMRVIGDICEKAIADYNLKLTFIKERDIDIIDGYVGRGYALSRPEELKLIGTAARTDGLILDPVYTGKAFFGMIEEMRRTPGCFGDRIIFIHTGGIFGLFPKAREIAPYLE